jgi:hypothetical protein
LTGTADPSHETEPVRVATNLNYESPQIRNNTSQRPAPMPLTLTVTVAGLKPGTTYNLFRYDSVASVPNTDFNANKSLASQEWTFTAGGASYRMTQVIESDEEVIYRAVPAAGA